ncbi:class I SAM-dependent methyltransferase [Pedobacter sp. WC2423]|uniref:class I SAM-dependent methyltransferase n=1 Tax=Pedobacter sp. WC2423 TaxID=3234142 RepID=UPI0034679600
MNDKLYKEFASYYADVTNDRDFKSQLEVILATYEPDKPCKSLLELFAGQSLHSIEAQKQHGIDVWAIDSSMDMKRLAIAEGFQNPKKYIVADLPDAMLSIDETKFDCITCLYNGLSNLNMEDVFMLLKNCKDKLTDNGKMFVEMHDIFLMTEYLSNQQVHYTEIENSKGELIKYAWPSGKIRWDRYTYRAEIPVQFLIQTPQRTDTIEFTHYDNMYCAEHIVFLANLVGLESMIYTEHPAWANLYPNSVILQLSIRKDLLKSAANDK